ncbi:MAG: HAD family hydrolase [Lachnospiraceae bacterium]|nr:HAD family hydrolase [Lachnospiraceae bacterium]
MKAVLFDLDGTLSNSKEGITKCVQYALKHFGIEEPDRDKLEIFIGPPLVDSFMNFYGMSLEDAKIATAKYRERYTPIGIHEASMYPGTRECIEELKKQGYIIGMASSKPEEYCRIILEDFGILDLFDDVVGATMDGRIDSKEEVLMEVFRRWSHYGKDEMCLIGDSIYDVEGANLVGIPCIAVSYGFGDVKEMTEAGAVAVIDNLVELPDVLKKM